LVEGVSGVDCGGGVDRDHGVVADAVVGVFNDVGPDNRTGDLGTGGVGERIAVAVGHVAEKVVTAGYGGIYRTADNV